MKEIFFESIGADIQRIKQLDSIRKDEKAFLNLEIQNSAANRQKQRLSSQILSLTDLRDALFDISETTKQHQASIVTGILDNLDINHFYKMLDPHPAYTDLQIEPELTTSGTYQYWIKALTNDFVHGTYVQTRFSTAQANCAAIAIFLAVNQHLSKNLDTVILDDPSQSMDPYHKERLVETLANYQRQVIVATEDPHMFDLLSKCFNSPLVYELNPWTIDGTQIK